MPSGGCRSGMCGPRQGGGCGGGSCGAGQQRFPSQQGFHGGGQGGVHGGGQGGFNGGGASAGSQVPGQSPGGRPYADADDVPAPSLDEQAATHEDPGGNGDVKAGEKVFSDSCQGCHSEAKEKPKSQKRLAEFENWKKEEWERAIKAVESGRMPQGGKLSEEDKKNIIAYFNSQIAKEDLVAQGKKEQKEATAEVPQAQAQPPVPGSNTLPQGSSAPPGAGTVPQATVHSTPAPVVVPSFDALTADLTEKTTGDLLIAREATKGIRFSQEEVQKEDQRREKIDAEIERRQQAGVRSRMPAATTPNQPSASGFDKRWDQIINQMLLEHLDPEHRFRNVGEQKTAPAYQSPTMQPPNLQLQGYRW